MKPFLCNAGHVLIIGIGSLVLAASVIGEAVTDWRRRKRTWIGDVSHN
jgi:hypothetical protein